MSKSEKRKSATALARYRVLSLVLALCLLIGVMPGMVPEAEAIYNVNNAPAASVELLNDTQETFTTSTNGGFFRVIDGELWVWGKNNGYCLGISKGPDGSAATTETIVSEPMKLDYTFDSAVVSIQSDNSGSVYCMTENGTVYGWGGLLGKYIFVPSGLSSTAVQTPQVFSSELVAGAGHKLVRIVGHSPTYVAAEDEVGNWYIAGSSMCATPLIAEANGTVVGMRFKTVNDSFIDQLQNSYDTTTKTVTDVTQRVGGVNRTHITWIFPMHHSAAAFFLMSDGELWSYNYNDCGQNWKPTDAPNLCKVSSLEQNQEMLAAGIRMDTIISTGRMTAVIDNSGSVWLTGYNTGFYPAGNDWRKPYKSFDANLYGVKCIKVYVSETIVAYLCEDNSLYVVGKNLNQFISTDLADGAYVNVPTQVFSNISAAETITAVSNTSNGIMVVTKSGSMYYAGDRSTGGAGDGNTDPVAPGEVTESKPATIPPIKPLTKNRMIFEIETADGTTYRYNQAGDTAGDGKSVTKTTPGGQSSQVSYVDVNAGQTCKLNVYFEDFGKLDLFVVPIRFNTNFVKIVNGSGVAYDDTKVITPGTVGESVGIVKQFTNAQWAGGVLAGNNAAQGTYPKICNGEGWLSVMGYSMTSGARIDGEVKMFSVYFTAQQGMVNDHNLTAFEMATTENVWNVTTVSGYGYDQNYPKGGQWQVRAAADVENPAIGKFEFSTDSYVAPAVKTSLYNMKTLALELHMSDGTKLPTDDYTYTDALPNLVQIGGAAAVQAFNGPQLAFNNKTSTYTVHLNYTDANTSFPQVDWSYEVVGDSSEKYIDNISGGELDGPHPVDYLVTVVNGDTAGDLKFKVSDNYPEGVTTVVRFTATTRRGQPSTKKTASIDVILTETKAPIAIQILEKTDLTDDTVVYDSLSPATGNKKMPTTFTVGFTPDPEDGNFNSTAVIWTLFDASGNVIPNVTDAETPENTAAAAGLTQPQAAKGKWTDDPSKVEANGYVAPSVGVRLFHTTFGSDKLTLRVASAADPTVYDEVYIKIHQVVSEIRFTQTTLFMATNSTRDLRALLDIGPKNEYYDVDLEWTIHPTNPGDDYLYLSDSNLTSTNRPTMNGKDIFYETITVKDTLTGVESGNSLTVAVVSLDSPIESGDIEVFNKVGTKADYATVYGLKPGDTVIFTKTFATEPDTTGLFSLKNDGTGYNKDQTKINAFNAKLASQLASTTDVKKFEVTAEMLGNPPTDETRSYDFPLIDMLASNGGDIGFILMRDYNAAGDEHRHIYDKIPVSYGHEPSKVFGYVRLEGKDANSAQNAGIEVQLIGLSNPAKVYTNQEGYFIFDEYIIPGNYTMILYKENYLRRVIQADVSKGYNGITITAGEEFAISTYDKPIYLYPGDLDGNGAISANDVNIYVRNWVGQVDYVNISDFAKYDFYDGGTQAIDLDDLNWIIRRNGWVKENYANWYVPSVS